MDPKGWEQLLETSDGTELLVSVVDALRPSRSADSIDGLIGLVETLEQSETARYQLEDALWSVLSKHRLVHALAESGILSDRGMVTEFVTRLTEQFLPLPLPDDDVRELLRTVFHRRSDWRWVKATPDETWERLFRLFVEDSDFSGLPHPDIASAILGLAQRAGALGIDEEVNARLEGIDDYDSPFLDLSRQAHAMLQEVEAHDAAPERSADLMATIERCHELVLVLRENRAVHGTSLRLTAVTRRLHQQLQRMELLIHLVSPTGGEDFAESLVPLFKEVVEAELTSRSLPRMLQGHADLFAFQITEETAKKGIKYVTDTTAGYWAFLRKAMIGGAIVAVFAIFKLLLGKLDLSLGSRAILYSMNYAACFVTIYLTGSILATKQPAMTASAIGRHIDEASTDEEAIAAVGEMIVLVWRSQFISFVGNLICAFPIAILIVWGASELGFTIVDSKKAGKLALDIDPLRSGSLAYAAVAGFYLYAAGVLSGWIDNHAAYTRLETRLRALPWPGSLRERGAKVSQFIVDNLGVVSGNIILGFMLGTAGTLGYIFDVPFDIRHIAFSSANFGVSLFAAPASFDIYRVIWCATGVLGIGLVNFVVSFGLTLVTTMESRQSSFRSWRNLGGWLLGRLWTRPLDWVFPPKTPTAAQAD